MSRGTVRLTNGARRWIVNYLHKQKKQTSTAIALLVLYILFLVLSLLTYLRTFLTIQLNPGFVPLSAERAALEKERKKNKKRTGRGRDIEAQPWIPPDSNPDSPGLEAFYSKDVFVCELDGRPKWCSDCRTWKPDRAHHSSELDRCVRKMDHLCPWVGGVISETCETLQLRWSDRLVLMMKQPLTFLFNLLSTPVYTVPFA